MRTSACPSAIDGYTAQAELMLDDAKKMLCRAELMLDSAEGSQRRTELMLSATVDWLRGAVLLRGFAGRSQHKVALMLCHSEFVCGEH